MTRYIDLLLKDFPKPPSNNAESAKADFSAFNLTQDPPVDLRELYEAYGPGTFHCHSGDSIELFPPFAATKDLLAFATSNWLQVLDSGILIDGDSTIPRAFFDTAKGLPPTNLILWGGSDNGVLLMSLWMSHTLGWCVLLMDQGFNKVRCFFKSPAAVIWEAFFSSEIRDIFPGSEGPYHFERSSRV